MILQRYKIVPASPARRCR